MKISLLLRIEFFPTCCFRTKRKRSFRFGQKSKSHNSTNSDIIKLSVKQDRSEWLNLVIFTASVWRHAMQVWLLVMQALVMFLEPSLLVQACQQPSPPAMRSSAIACPHAPSTFCNEEASPSLGQKVSMMWCPGLCCPKSAPSMRQLVSAQARINTCRTKWETNIFRGLSSKSIALPR